MTEALKHLQKTVGTVADGAFGPDTARKIVSHYGYTPLQGAHLLGQCYHESAGFTVSVENLNYSASSIVRVWPSRFASLAEAKPFARNPMRLANNVYAGRMGNGDEESGEGFKYRGRGFIQLTGKDNYRAFSEAVNRPGLVEDPEPVAVEYAFVAAVWYFGSNGLFVLARNGVDDDTIKKVTRRVNGGYHGLEERMEWTRKIYEWLK